MTLLNAYVMSIFDADHRKIYSVYKDKVRGDFNNTYLNDRDQLISLMGRIMAQRLLLDQGVAEDELDFITHNVFGKPTLRSSNIDFNISHSGDIVIAVVSPKKNVGVDLEQIRGINLMEYKDAFSPVQWVSICKSANPNRLFFELWTKKESLLKAYGIGLQADLGHVNIHNTQGQIEGDSRIGHFKKIEISDCICFICTDFECEKVNVEWFKY